MTRTTNFPGQLARMTAIVAVTALSLGLAACNKAQEPPTVGQQIDSAVQNAERAAEDAKVKAEQALKTTEGALQQGANQSGDAMKDAAHSVGALADDATITARISAELAKDSELSAIKIDVDTKAGAVRLSGPAPSDAAKQRATSLAQAVDGVKSVDNELVVTKS